MMGGHSHAPSALLPKKTLYLLYKRLDGQQVWSGRVRFSTPGFDPRTVQPAASRYTDPLFITSVIINYYLKLI
jgi:hypothetical protein